MLIEFGATASARAFPINATSEKYGWARYVAHQVYYSLLGREYEWELLPLGVDQKVGALVWSPLGWGRLFHHFKSFFRSTAFLDRKATAPQRGVKYSV